LPAQSSPPGEIVIVYGRNPVREALRGRRARAVQHIWATAGAARESWLRERGVRICGPEEIERRCGSPSHQGVCADAGPYPYASAGELFTGDAPLIVVLDQVQDPQNLGSICRTAECAGSSGVVIAERRSAEITPAACKASAGAVEHLLIARVRNVADFLISARKTGCWCYGASIPAGGRSKDTSSSVEAAGSASTSSRAGPSRGAGPSTSMAATASGAGAASRAASVVPYTDPDYRGGVVLVLGSEGRGLRPRVASECDRLIFLPIHGHVESLGVAAAAGALLYGILQAREQVLDKSP
jgi:23S rRNA (guanosine2251-2'-O)-methyltransferase